MLLPDKGIGNQVNTMEEVLRSKSSLTAGSEIFTVIGVVTRTKYGIRKSGDQFLLDRRDMEAQPHLFAAVQERSVPAPAPQPVTPPPPSAIGWGDLSDKIVKILKSEGFDSIDDLRGIPEPQLKSIKGIGSATVKKIASLLA